MWKLGSILLASKAASKSQLLLQTVDASFKNRCRSQVPIISSVIFVDTAISSIGPTRLLFYRCHLKEIQVGLLEEDDGLDVVHWAAL